MDTPQVPFQKLSQNSSSHLSQLSAPLFTEDRYSTSTDNDQENCDAEVTKITRWQSPSQVTTIVISPKRPVSTPSMVDYSTRVIQTKLHHKETMSIAKTIQPQQSKVPIIISFKMGAIDASMIYKTKSYHISILENRYNAYLVELPDLKLLLCTSRYLMDEITGQFYAVFWK